MSKVCNPQAQFTRAELTPQMIRSLTGGSSVIIPDPSLAPSPPARTLQAHTHGTQRCWRQALAFLLSRTCTIGQQHRQQKTRTQKIRMVAGPTAPANLVQGLTMCPHTGLLLVADFALRVMPKTAGKSGTEPSAARRHQSQWDETLHGSRGPKARCGRPACRSGARRAGKTIMAANKSSAQLCMKVIVLQL